MQCCEKNEEVFSFPTYEVPCLSSKKWNFNIQHQMNYQMRSCNLSLSICRISGNGVTNRQLTICKSQCNSLSCSCLIKPATKCRPLFPTFLYAPCCKWSCTGWFHSFCETFRPYPITSRLFYAQMMFKLFSTVFQVIEIALLECHVGGYRAKWLYEHLR